MYILMCRRLLFENSQNITYFETFFRNDKSTECRKLVSLCEQIVWRLPTHHGRLLHSKYLNNFQIKFFV